AVDRGHLDDLLGERSLLDAERMGAVTDLVAAAAVAEHPPPDGAAERAARVASARQALVEAERRAAAHGQAHDEVEHLARQLEAATEAEAAARAAAAGADAAVAEAQLRATELGDELARLEASLAEAIVSEAEAERLLAHHHATPGPEQVEDLRAKVTEVAAALQLREGVASDAAGVLAHLQDEQRAAAAALSDLQGDDDEADEPPLAEEIEWYLLARLAAQRAVSLGGSVPLLLDDALSGVLEPGLGRILGRLERMADAVQVILVTDDAAAASWASLAGPGRAAVVGVQRI
ncbi:MAG: hypothetical protein Q8K72_03715, partial [Acidimicrobiales bacterium]|nr:hypothetical protein [Acidimicrobiales bacterium]